MMLYKKISILAFVCLLPFATISLAGVQDPEFREKKSDAAWEANLRYQNFQDRPIIEGRDLTPDELEVLTF